ncbi:FHA domain-containing protein [Massilia glaciei]|uniref:FHA domain-containing protein n=1 Tax=Massilia glaciei TaxID=1524097 RepID=A0A2U2HLI3_9BURK|nr:FHA domain-containing protein [Massilia glaciei]PWF48292.1 FHA domain-containing protein [Massilia glaciei]
MSGPYFIETLARNGDVLHRQQVGTLPIRIGRGYDNDIIVDDAHAAPRHALVDLNAEGQLELRDLGSRNGVVHRGRRLASVVLTGDTVVRMGHTSLRVRAADFPVPTELVDRTMHNWEGFYPGLVGLVIIALVAVLTVWLADTETFRVQRYLQTIAFGVGLGLIWGGAWALANRLFGQHARMGRHLFILACGMAAVTLYKFAASMTAYAFSLESLTRFGSIVAIALGAGMVFFHLRTVKPHHPRRFANVCLLFAILAAGLTLIGNEQRRGQFGDNLYMSLLLPPSLRMSPDHSVDQFMAGAGALKAKLDAERTEKVSEDADAEE